MIDEEEGSHALFFFLLYLILTNGKLMICNNKVYAGKNLLDLTKDTVYIHPTTKQCNYSIDTSNFVTKTELNKVKGMIDVSARVVGSKQAIAGNASQTVTVPVSIDYDYIEIYPAFTINKSASEYSGYAAVASSVPVIVAKDGTGIISVEDCEHTAGVQCSASQVYFYSTGNYIHFDCTVVFYKYDS